MLSATFQVPQNIFTQASRSAGTSLTPAQAVASTITAEDRIPDVLPGAGSEAPGEADAPIPGPAAATSTSRPWLVPLGIAAGLAAAWFLFLKPAPSAKPALSGTRRWR